ncbi:MAG: protein O-mannosyl-transferase family, partial [Acidobacteriota bacterium]
LYVTGRTLLGPRARFAAVTVALLFAFSQTFWSQAVIAEVYTLNALILICIFYLLIRWERDGALWPVALCAGLGLTVHPLQALFFPGWIYFIYRSPRRANIDYEQIKKSIAVFAAALCLHFYPLLRSKANPPLDWGNPENLKNWIAYITAAQYRDRMFSVPFSTVLENAGQGFRLLLNQLTPWLILLPIAGATVLLKKQKRLFIVTLLPAVLTFLYAINYDIPWEIDVYYIPIVLVSTLWILWLLSLIPQKFSYALPLLAAIPLILNFHHNDRSKNTIALDYGIDLLSTAPEKSALILPQTDAAFTVLYLTAAEQKRNDLSVWVYTDDGVRTLRDGVNPNVPSVPMERFLAEQKDVYLAQRVAAETVPGYDQ